MSKFDKGYFSVNSRSSAYLTGRMGGYAKAGTELALDKYFSGLSHEDKIALFHEILNDRIHGISFSPYVDGQSPGTEISEAQIRERLSIIQPYCRWIRSFSCIDGNQAIPRIGHENGLKTMVGISLSDNREMNEVEFANGIEIARAGEADILAVGNEVLLRGELSEDELIEYIERAQGEAGGVPVGYVDAYFLFEKHPRLTEACDILLINCYPFWEECEAQYALQHMRHMYQLTQQVAKGKKVVISETGWPSTGTAYGGAVPSYENALEYFIATYQWAQEEDVDVVYFSSFDELWKIGDEGDVGAYWGLWDKDGKLKYV